MLILAPLYTIEDLWWFIVFLVFWRRLYWRNWIAFDDLSNPFLIFELNWYMYLFLAMSDTVSKCLVNLCKDIVVFVFFFVLHNRQSSRMPTVNTTNQVLHGRNEISWVNFFVFANGSLQFVFVFFSARGMMIICRFTFRNFFWIVFWLFTSHEKIFLFIAPFLWFFCLVTHLFVFVFVLMTLLQFGWCFYLI